MYGSTQAGNSIFLHIMSWPDEKLLVPLAGPVANVTNLSGGTVEWQTGTGGLQLEVPPSSRGNPVTILEISRN